MGRVTTALARFAERARASSAADALLAVATSAVRDAANREDFLRRVAASGFEPRLLSGEQEAATTFAGVCSRAPGGESVSADGTLMVDVGGGSTELVLGAAGGVAWSRSLQAGCVRMTERFLGEDVVSERTSPPAPPAVAELLEVVPDEVVDAAQRVIAVAGTATTLAADRTRRRTSRTQCTAPASRARRCASCRSASARCRSPSGAAFPGLEAARAPVIVAGLVVLGCVLDRFGIDEAIVSERDILHGAALLAAGKALAA